MSPSPTTRLRPVLGLVGLAWLGSYLAFWSLPSVFETWNAQTLDRLFVLRSAWPGWQPPYDSTVVHIDLTNSSLQALNQAYLDRTHYARVVDNLAAMGVAAQVWDAIFPAPLHQEADQRLIEAVAAAGSVYLGAGFSLEPVASRDLRGPIPTDHRAYLDQSGWHVVVQGPTDQLLKASRPLLTFPALARVTVGLGFLNARADPDGVYRRVPLLVRYEEGFYPSLALRAVCAYLGVPPDQILLEPGRHLVLHQARLPDRDVRDITIPIDAQGQMIINYIGPWERMAHYDFADMYYASEDREALALWGEELAGRLAIVADVSNNAGDIGPVPTDTHYPLSGMHASVVHTILTQDFLRESPTGLMLVLEGVFLGLILVLAVRVSLWPFILGSLSLGMGYSAVVVLGFLYGNMLFNWVRPITSMILGVVFLAWWTIAQARRERQFVQEAFGHYLAPAVVEQLVEQPETLGQLGGIEREMTAFFSDIASFTTLSECLTPRQLVDFINEYLSEMCTVIEGYGGPVDKFEGDAIVAFFGAPFAFGDHAQRAVQACLEQQERLEALRGRWQREKRLPTRLETLRRAWEKDGKIFVQVRMGVAAGTIVVGNMGSRTRSDYTMMGDTVNLAARFESAQKLYGTSIMVNQAVYEAVKTQMETRRLDMIQVLGKDEAVRAYEILGHLGTLPEATYRMLELYNEGLAQYEQYDFAAAHGFFEQALIIAPGDGPSQVYVERCKAFRANPPSDLIFRAPSK